MRLRWDIMSAELYKHSECLCQTHWIEVTTSVNSTLYQFHEWWNSKFIFNGRGIHYCVFLYRKTCIFTLQLSKVYVLLHLNISSWFIHTHTHVFYHITSHHITPHHITPYHITSHHIILYIYTYAYICTMYMYVCINIQKQIQIL